MAQATFSFIGYAIGGPIGGFIGNVLGSMVDNQLFPVKQEGPRLRDLTVTASSYGVPIPRFYGPRNRVAGNVIWSSGLIETKKKTKSGGKGGPSVQTTEYSYRTHLAVLIGSGRKAEGMSRVRRMWANSKLIFDADQTYTTDVARPGGGWITRLVLAAAQQNASKVFGSLRFYPGNHDQLPDPTIESYLGVGNVPAYRGSCYVVVADLQLADYGNRLPNLEFELEADDEIDVASVCADICDAAGIDPYTVSTSLVANQDLQGYVISRPCSAIDALQPIALAYNFDVADNAGNLRMQKRGTSVLGIIPTEDLAGHAPGENMPDPLQWTRMMETALPRQATITYPDPDRDLQPNSQSATREEGSSENNLASEIRVVLSPDHGREIADRMLWEAHNGREGAEGSLNDRWLSLTPGRSYILETPAGLERMRIIRRTRGVNGVIEFTVKRDSTQVYLSNTAGEAASVPGNYVTIPGDSYMLALDTPLFRDSDDDTGFYLIAGGDKDGWRGAEVYRSVDGTAYQAVASFGAGAVLGDVATALGSGPTAFWDRTNTITVTLDNPDEELSSVTELEVLNGANVGWLGLADGSRGELFQFATADEIAPGVWMLSDLLRGRMGTEWTVGQHTANERFVQIEGGNFARVDFTASDWNKLRHYKPVSLLQTVQDADPQSFTNTGEGKKPLSPVNVQGNRDGSDNITLSWVRRSRIRAPGLGNGLVPLGEEQEYYEIDVTSGLSGAVVRTIQVTGATTASYTAAEQTADGLTPGNPVGFEIYQMSAIRGRGHGAVALI